MLQEVTNNKEKYETYKKLKERYKLAIEEEFYFEAILIVYAIMEDRLKSFFFHIGAIESMESRRLDIYRTSKVIVPIYNQYYEKKLDFNSIQTKIDLTKSLLEWSLKDEPLTDGYATTLKKWLSVLDTQAVLDNLEMMRKWCSDRNDIIHGLMNKKVDLETMNLQEYALKGNHLANSFNNQVQRIKRKKQSLLKNK